MKGFITYFTKHNVAFYPRYRRLVHTLHSLTAIFSRKNMLSP